MGPGQQPRRRFWARWGLIGLNIAVLGCAPVQHDAEVPTPRLGDLQLPTRVTMGCPARLTVTFDAADGGNLRADVRLVRHSSRGREMRQMTIDYDPDTSARGRAGTQLTLTQPDVYCGRDKAMEARTVRLTEHTYRNAGSPRPASSLLCACPDTRCARVGSG
jgi:hypothetical protein